MLFAVVALSLVLGLGCAASAAAVQRSAAERLAVVCYSDKSNGGREVRRNILSLTVGQWSRLGFEVHVVADAPDLVLPCAASVVQAGSEEEYTSWHAIDYLKRLVGPSTGLVAFAEDDIFLPDEALEVWLAEHRKIFEHGYRLGFHRVEGDSESLTDTTHAWDSWRYARGIVWIDGNCFIELEQPYSAIFMMTGAQFREEYVPSIWSSWETCRPHTPWDVRATAAAGLTWLGRGEERTPRRVVTPVEHGSVLHLWPMGSRPYPYAYEHGKYTRRHLQQLCVEMNYSRRWRRATLFARDAKAEDHPRHATPSWMQQPDGGLLYKLTQALQHISC